MGCTVPGRSIAIKGKYLIPCCFSITVGPSCVCVHVCVSVSSVVLFVVNPMETNVFDQRVMEFALWHR